MSILGSKGQSCFCALLLVITSVAPAAERPVYGYASWYGGSFHGRRAASGENYDMMQLTAAHRTLPFGARVRVHRLDNDESVVVRINDRGPYVGTRLIDLSLAAARQLSMTEPGVVPVTLEVLEAPVEPEAPVETARPVVLPVVQVAGSYAVQVAAFKSPQNAERTRIAMAMQFGSARVVVRQGEESICRVVVGSVHTRAEAEVLVNSIRSQFKTFAGAYVVRLDGGNFAAAD